MASTDALPVPRKNTAYRITFPILDADGDLVTGATGLDSEVSKDAGTFADCTNEATEIATSSGMYYLDLTSTEMNADTVALIIKTSSSGAKTTPIVLYPQEADDIRVNTTYVGGTSQTARDIGASVLLSTGTGTGQLDFTSGVVKSNVTQFGGTNATATGGRPEVNTTHLAGTAYASADLSSTMKASVNTEADTALSDYGALKPTTAGRTLDVSTGGEAGIDWANVGSPTTSLALTGTTIATTQKVDVETIKTNPVVNAGTITFPTTATLASTTNITAGTITTTTTATNVTTVNGLAAGVITAASIAADAITDAKVASDVTIASVTGAVGSVTGAVGSVTGNVGGSVASVVGAVGSVTGNVGGNVTGSVGSIATGGITTASFAAGAINAAAIATDAIGSDEISAAAVTKIQSGLSTLTQTQVTGGAYALNSASFAFNAAMDFTTTQKAATLARVTLVDTTTTNTDMRGTNNAALAADLATANTALAKLDDTVENNAGTYRFTTAALVNAPSGSGLDAAGVRDAVGLASANLDTQLGAIDDLIDTEVAAIKAKTDNLPESPAASTDAAAAIVTYGLDHLVSAAVAGADVADNSIVAKLVSKLATADWDSFTSTTDSLEAIRDRGDAAWLSGSSSLSVYPLSTTVNERVTATAIQAYYQEAGWTIGPVVVTDSDGDPVNLNAYDDLKLIIQDGHGDDVLVTTEVTVSGADNNQWTATGTGDVTATAPAKLRWALRGISTDVNVVLGLGQVLVGVAADEDEVVP